MRRTIPFLEIVKTRKRKDLAFARLKSYEAKCRKEKKGHDDKN